jgi:hypothetical protein
MKSMHRQALVPFLLAGLLVCASPVAALWETRFGSEERDYHCSPVEAPVWNPPTLHHFDAWEDEYFSNEHLGLWVLDGSAVPWLEQSGNVIIARSWASYLKIYDDDFNVWWEVQMDITMANALDLVDMLGTGEPQILLPPGLGTLTGLYDLRGDLIANWAPAALVPGVLGLGGTHMGMPATADFTGDGNLEALLHGVYQWYGFNNQGETIVQHPVIHPYDKGWSTSSPHEENGRTYIYAITMSYPGLTVDDSLPVASRLHKQVLEPVPGGLFAPYRLHEIWTNEFPGLVHVDDLRFFDFTGDGQNEIVLSHRPRGHPDTKALSIMDLDGDILYQHAWNTGSKTSIGDVNGDGIQEVVVLLIDDEESDERQLKPWAYLSGVQWDGHGFKEIYHFQIDDEYGGMSMAVCDVDGDGADEVLVALGEGLNETVPHGRGRAKLINGDGTILWNYEFPYGAPFYPRIVDLDNDGNYEFLITTSATQLFVFSATAGFAPENLTAHAPDPYHQYLLERPHLAGLVTEGSPAATTGKGVPSLTEPIFLLLIVSLLVAWRRR